MPSSRVEQSVVELDRGLRGGEGHFHSNKQPHVAVWCEFQVVLMLAVYLNRPVPLHRYLVFD